MITFLCILFMAVSALLVVVILMQRGRGGGLAGAFGSGGGGNSAFGTKIGDVFTTVTVVLFVIFLLLSVGLNYAFHDHKETISGAVQSQPALTGAGAAAAAGNNLQVSAPADAATQSARGALSAATASTMEAITRPAPAAVSSSQPATSPERGK